MGFCRVKLLTLVNLNAPIVYTHIVPQTTACQAADVMLQAFI